jgi:hypothetical protein
MPRNEEPLLLVPMPDGTTFKSNTLSINSPIYDTADVKQIYTHKGDYVVTSSSYADDSHIPANVFNNDKSTWKSNYKDNNFDFKCLIPKYSKDPYSNANKGPSIYQGGGLPENYFITMVNNNSYKGEWIQIRLPNDNEAFPMYLFRYTIETPAREEGETNLPKTFLLVGSVDGNKWEYIDMRTLPLDQQPTNNSKTYDVNVLSYYYYYRFIFIDFFPKNSVAEISNIRLYGYTELTPNKNAIREGFTNITNDYKLSYSQFNLSKQLDEFIKPEPHNIVKVVDINHASNKDNTIYMSIFLTILASSIIYLVVKK